MRKIFLRSLAFCLVAALCVGGFVGWRVWNVFNTGYSGFQHLRYLLESGETVTGAPAEEALSDNYLLSLFGNNPDLVESLKTVVDLGMATDANLKLGNVTAMVVTYRVSEAKPVFDAAIYAIGGFPDPNSKRLGFHSTGYFQQELDADLWLTGNALLNLLGRDVIVFCEQDKAEAHMELLYNLLSGGIMPLAQRVVEAPLHYAIVIPNPKEVAPPQLRNSLQTMIYKGEMTADAGKTEIQFISPTPSAAGQVFTLVSDMHMLAQITLIEKFSGVIKEMPWGPMNDMWWSVELGDMANNMEITQDNVLVAIRVEYDRFKNNAILKTVERAGRDLSAQKAFQLSGEMPWEFAFKEKDSPSGGYWSHGHKWGNQWPLGDDGIPTPGSIKAAEERELARLAKEAAAAAAKAQALAAAAAKNAEQQASKAAADAAKAESQSPKK